MKKIMVFVLAVGLLVCGCSSKPEKTKEELQAEIKVELEAGMQSEEKIDKEKTEEISKAVETSALKSDMEEVEDVEKNAEETRIEETSIQDTNTEVSDNVDDLYNTERLYEFVFDTLGGTPEDEYVLGSYECVLADITGDGAEEALVFQNTGKTTLPQVVCVKLKDGKYTTIPCELSGSGAYTQDVTFDGTFIHHYTKYGGTGMAMISDTLARFDGEEIKQLNINLVLSGYASGPEYFSETTGKTFFAIPGDFTEFTHEVTTRGSSTEFSTASYKFNEETGLFDIFDELTGESRDAVGVAESAEDGLYTEGALKAVNGNMTEDLRIQSIHTGNLGRESFAIELEGNAWVSGTLSGMLEPVFSFDVFPIQEKLILPNVVIGSPEILDTRELGSLYFVKDETGVIDDAVLAYLNSGKTIPVEIGFDHLVYEETAVEAMMFLEITSIWIDEDIRQKIDSEYEESHE